MDSSFSNWVTSRPNEFTSHKFPCTKVPTHRNLAKVQYTTNSPHVYRLGESIATSHIGSRIWSRAAQEKKKKRKSRGDSRGSPREIHTSRRAQARARISRWVARAGCTAGNLSPAGMAVARAWETATPRGTRLAVARAILSGFSPREDGVAFYCRPISDSSMMWIKLSGEWR